MRSTIEPPTTKSVLIRMSFGDTTAANGTGFIVLARPVKDSSMGEYFLVTARHNFTGKRQGDNTNLSDTGILPDKVTIFHHSCLGLGRWVEIEQPLIDPEDGCPLWIEHPIGKEKYDIAALKIDMKKNMLLSTNFNPSKQTLYYDTHRTYDSMNSFCSSQVSVIGFPFGMGSSGVFPVWLTGWIASEMDLSFGGNPAFLIDCRTRKGCSGAPVITYSKGGYRDDYGSYFTADDGGPCIQPLGLYSGRVRDDADIGIVWKWQVVRETLAPYLCGTIDHIKTVIGITPKTTS